MKARIAAMYIHAHCLRQWPVGGDMATEGNATVGTNMASTVANGSFIDVFDHKGGGTHKYIPAERLTLDLEQPVGGGVYGYWKMADDSYLLLTCKGPLAIWSGKDEDKAEWVP